MSTQNQNISTKICVYGCGLNLYWNTSTNEYWELFAKKKHVCPNRTNNNSNAKPTNANSSFYNKKVEGYNVLKWPIPSSC